MQAGLRGYRDVVRVGQSDGWAWAAISSPRSTASAVTEPDAFTRAASRKRPGDVMDLTIYRGGKSMDVKVKLGEAPEDAIR